MGTLHAVYVSCGHFPRGRYRPIPSGTRLCTRLENRACHSRLSPLNILPTVQAPRRRSGCVRQRSRTSVIRDLDVRFTDVKEPNRSPEPLTRAFPRPSLGCDRRDSVRVPFEPTDDQDELRRPRTPVTARNSANRFNDSAENEGVGFQDRSGRLTVVGFPPNALIVTRSTGLSIGE